MAKLCHPRRPARSASPAPPQPARRSRPAPRTAPGSQEEGEGEAARSEGIGCCRGLTAAPPPLPEVR